MKKVKFYCSIGYPSAMHEEIFEIDDNWSKEDIEYELWQWAEQFLEAWIEDADDE